MRNNKVKPKLFLARLVYEDWFVSIIRLKLNFISMHILVNYTSRNPHLSRIGRYMYIHSTKRWVSSRTNPIKILETMPLANRNFPVICAEWANYLYLSSIAPAFSSSVPFWLVVWKNMKVWLSIVLHTVVLSLYTRMLLWFCEYVRRNNGREGYKLLIKLSELRNN